MVVKVSREDVRCEQDEIDKYLDVLNGIAFSCEHYDEFSPGSRNKVAVDLTVSSYMLGMDPIDVLDMFVNNDLIDYDADDEDTDKRVEKVLDYTEWFTYDWMVEPDDYADVDRFIPQKLSFEMTD